MDLNIKAEVEELATKTKADLEAKLSAVATKAEMNTLTEKATELETALKTQGTVLAEINSRMEAKKESKSFGGELKKAIDVVADSLKSMKESRGAANISIKAAHNMFVSNITPAVAGMPPYIVTDFETGITPIPWLRQPFLREIMDTKMTTKMYIAWAEQTNIQGDAAPVTEGGLKPLNSLDIMEKTTKVEKIAKMIKTSKENLDDIPEMMTLIQDELRMMVELKLDEQIYKGSGISPELSGLINIIPAFAAAPPFVAGIVEPNYADVIMTAAAVVASHGFTANYALVNPMDLVMLQMYKTLQGVYVIPPFATSNGTMVGGIRVIASNLIPQDNFVVGDFSKAHVRLREDFIVDIGYDGTDFSHNLVSIIGEIRAAFFIKSNEIPAFVKGLFSTALAAIAKP